MGYFFRYIVDGSITIPGFMPRAVGMNSIVPAVAPTDPGTPQQARSVNFLFIFGKIFRKILIDIATFLNTTEYS